MHDLRGQVLQAEAVSWRYVRPRPKHFLAEHHRHRSLFGGDMRLGVVQQRADVVFLVTRCFGVFVVVIKTLDVKKKCVILAISTQ